MQEMRVIFRGKVQGVGFRWTVEDHARQLGLAGTAKNLKDGTVEVCLQGSQNKLEHFLEAIQSDPGNASIDDISTEYQEAKKIMNDFRIVH